MNDTRLLIDRLTEHFETKCGDAHFSCGEAADEIERLQAALKDMIDLAEGADDWTLEAWEIIKAAKASLRIHQK